MKKILILLAALFAVMPLFSQNTVEECRSRYETQVKNVGLSGVGVETILEKWESLAPDDEQMLFSKFLFLYNKSRGSEVISRFKPKYLGNEPVMSLKDSTGRKVYYFQDTVFDSEYYGDAMRVLENLVSKDRTNLKYRFSMVAVLKEFEKEDIVLTLQELRNLVTENQSGPAWHYDSEAVSRDTFTDSMQEYCAGLYAIGSDSAYEAFRQLSELLAKQNPKNPVFLDNIGSYWMSAKGNYKKALSFYKKALKLDPEDRVAITNKRIAEKKMAAAGK